MTPEPNNLAVLDLPVTVDRAVLDLPTWSSTQGLSKWLEIPVQTIHQWRHRGIAPRAHRIGRHLRFHRDDIAEWLAEHADPRPGAA